MRENKSVASKRRLIVEARAGGIVMYEQSERSSSDGEERWKNDLYNELDQAPKTPKELEDTYGHNIRLQQWVNRHRGVRRSAGRIPKVDLDLDPTVRGGHRSEERQHWSQGEGTATNSKNRRKKRNKRSSAKKDAARKKRANVQREEMMVHPERVGGDNSFSDRPRPRRRLVNPIALVKHWLMSETLASRRKRRILADESNLLKCDAYKMPTEIKKQSKRFGSSSDGHEGNDDEASSDKENQDNTTNCHLQKDLQYSNAVDDVKNAQANNSTNTVDTMDLLENTILPVEWAVVRSKRGRRRARRVRPKNYNPVTRPSLVDTNVYINDNVI